MIATSLETLFTIIIILLMIAIGIGQYDKYQKQKIYNECMTIKHDERRCINYVTEGKR